jgi:hypothetical protein
MALSALFQNIAKESSGLESSLQKALAKDIEANRIEVSILDPETGMLQLVPGDFSGKLRVDFAMALNTNNSKIYLPISIKAGVPSINISESTANSLMVKAIKNSHTSDSKELSRVKNAHLAVTLCSMGGLGALTGKGFSDGDIVKGCCYLAASALIAISSWLQLKRR